MKLNRTLVMCLTIALAATIAIGGSMAYLTSTDGQRNVMTVGNVEIVQNEYQRDENGELTDFQDGENKMLPAYYPGEATVIPGYDGSVHVNGKDYPIWDEAVDGVVDKIVTVENTGSEELFVRTIVAFEHTDPNNDGDFSDGIAWKVHFLGNYGEDKPWDAEFYTGTMLDNLLVGGKYWSLVTFTHKDAVPAGTEENPSITEPSLMQVFFEKDVDGDDLAAVNGEYEIIVLSQAVQSQMGGLTAEQALDEAFCDMSDANAAQIAQWLKGQIPAAAFEGDGATYGEE